MNQKLGYVEISFKALVSQNTSMREINDMLLSISRYPSVSDVTMVSLNGKFNSNNSKEYPIKEYHSQDEKIREFPSE